MVLIPLLFTSHGSILASFIVTFIMLAITILAMGYTLVERKRAADQAMYFKLLFDNNLDAIYEIDLNGRFVDANQACQQIFGYDLSELVNMHFLDVIAPEDAARSKIAFEELKSGKTVRMELGCVHRTGKPLKVELIDFPIEVNGKVMGIFGIAKDVTSSKYSRELLTNQKRVLEMIASKRLTMENALISALENREFFLQLQPRVKVLSKHVTSVEALLRWNQPGVGMVPPSDFIPVAEETGYSS